MKTYIGISRDHSASMSSVSQQAARDYNNVISQIKQEAAQDNHDTIVSVVQCGIWSNGSTTNLFENINSSVSCLSPMPEGSYRATGRSTPLWDSVSMLIDTLEAAPDASTPEVGFLVMVITDGADNSSKINVRSLMSRISKLQSTDKWTFVFRVPKGEARTITSLGVPPGNVLEWELTSKGMEQSTVQTKQGLQQFYRDRKEGKVGTRSFYSNLSEVTTKELNNTLSDISLSVSIWHIDQDTAIRPFVEAKTGQQMVKGTAFYQLTKTESEVQDYKQVMIRDIHTGAVYTGAGARDMIGLPRVGTAKLIPGDHGQYEIYMQSTSVNRKLVAGTKMIHWPSATISK